MPEVKFETLWGAFPDGQPSQEKNAKGELLYPDQCAIKISVALHAVGVEMKSFTGAYTFISGKRAALRAEELAAWLDKMPFCGLPKKPESVTGVAWKAKANDRTGIMFFGDYWARQGESTTRASGDHIDLWKKSTLTPSVQSTLRFRLGIGRIPNLLGQAIGTRIWTPLSVFGSGKSNEKNVERVRRAGRGSLEYVAMLVLTQQHQSRNIIHIDGLQ